MPRSTRSWCVAACIAALYVGLTLALQAISFGTVQIRVSEALTLLPVVLVEAVPGLLVGCFLANLLAGANIIDVVFGTLATFIASLLTYRLRRNVWLAALPPVVLNAVIVGLILTYAYGVNALWINMLAVGAGEAVACYALGVPAVKLLQKRDLSRFR